MATPRRHRLVGILLSLASGIAVAAAPEDARVRLGTCMRELDASDATVRLAAHARLESDAELTLAVLEAALREAKPGSLSLEQIMRLDHAAYARFIREPRAAMGVQFNQLENIPDGVEINAPLDGFDSKRVLQPGDVIHRIDALPVRRQEDMRAAIVSYSPGDQVTLQITRQGEPLTVRLAMGRYADLDARNAAPLVVAGGARVRNGNQQFTRGSLDSPTLAKAWTLRRERLGGGLAVASRPLDLPISADQWDAASTAAERVSDAKARAASDAAIRQQMAGRVGVEAKLPDEARTAASGGSDRAGFNSVPATFAAGVVTQELNARALQLADSMARTRRMIANGKSLLTRKDLPAEQRKSLENEVNRLSVKLAEYEQQAKMLNAQPQRGDELVVP
jgi:PDZ domain